MSEPEPTTMSAGETYYPELDPCHIHWERHDKSKTYSECPEQGCKDYIAAKESGSLYQRKHRG